MSLNHQGLLNEKANLKGDHLGLISLVFTEVLNFICEYVVTTSIELNVSSEKV